MTPAGGPPRRRSVARDGGGPGRGLPAQRGRATSPPDPARQAAYDAIRAVHERDAYGNLVLPKLLAERGLDSRDAAFAVELGYGTLRAEGTLDHVLGLCSSRPVTEIDRPVLDALRLGAYQLLRTRVAPHAAVTTTVDLARAVAGEGAARFVNAVLRRVAERNGDVGAPDRTADPVGHLAITTAHPRWVVDAFRAALGGALDETEQALLADDTRPEVHLAVRPGRIARDGLLAACRAAGLDAVPGPWSPYAVRLAGGAPADVAPVRAGQAGVQDEGSQLAALALARLAPDAARVLDLCAAPGGKAALLAGTLPSAALLAVELHHHRAKLLARTLAGSRALAVVADGTAPAWPDRTFDAVLLDAPCTGLGSLRRRPESRWRRTPDDVARLVPLQRALLHRAVDSARDGGLVGYVVCSPHLAETVEAVRAVVSVRDDVELVDVRPALPGVPDLGAGPWVQLWPHRQGTDAMFVAVVRRNGGAPLS